MKFRRWLVVAAVLIALAAAFGIALRLIPAAVRDTVAQGGLPWLTG